LKKKPGSSQPSLQSGRVWAWKLKEKKERNFKEEIRGMK
jgi:hypothetical protein